MQPLRHTLALLIMSALPAIASANNTTINDTFGLGPEPVETVQYTETRYAVNDLFGLGGTYVVVQHCPNGQCPTVASQMVTRSTTTTRKPPLRPRTTVQRTTTQTQVAPTVVYDCPDGNCPLQTSTVYVPTERIISEHVVSRTPVAAACPTCPQPTVVYAEPVAVSGACPTCPNQVRHVTVNQPCPTCPDSYPAQAQARRNVVLSGDDWTWPGDLDRHLNGYPHYIPWSELNRMSYGEKVARHNQDHESGIGGGRRFARSNGYVFNGPIARRFRSRRGR